MTATQNSGADTVFAMALTYRNDGQITKQTYQHLGDDPRLQNYTYDNYRRLTGWSSEGATTYEQYIYDSVGNRKSHTRNFSPTAYSYATGTNQLTAVTGATLADSLSYDADGALITRKKERSMGNNNYLGVDNETFGYNYAGVVRRYEKSSNYKTLGSCQRRAGGQRSWILSVKTRAFTPSGGLTGIRPAVNPKNKKPLLRKNWQRLYQGEDTHCPLPDKPAPYGYEVRVRARNVHGFGKWSQET